MRTLDPETNFLLRVGLIPESCRFDAVQLQAALDGLAALEQTGRTIPATLDAVRRAAIDFLQAAPLGRPAWLETVRGALDRHLATLPDAQRPAGGARPTEADWSRYAQKISEPGPRVTPEEHEARAEAAKSWNGRADLQ